MNSTTRQGLPNKSVKPVVQSLSSDERTVFQLQIATQAKTIADLQDNLNKSTLAHAATRTLAGQHIGSLNIMLADYKGTKVDPSKTEATFEWEKTKPPVV